MKKVKNPKDIIRTKDRNALADAFAKTESGSFLAMQAREIGPRVHNIKELAHQTIMDMTRTTPYYRKRLHMVMDRRVKASKAIARNPYELFKAAKPVLKGIARRGGDEYERALNTLRFTWSSQKTLAETVTMLLG